MGIKGLISVKEFHSVFNRLLCYFYGVNIAWMNGNSGLTVFKGQV